MQVSTKELRAEQLPHVHSDSGPSIHQGIESYYYLAPQREVYLKYPPRNWELYFGSHPTTRLEKQVSTKELRDTLGELCNAVLEYQVSTKELREQV